MKKNFLRTFITLDMSCMSIKGQIWMNTRCGWQTFAHIHHRLLITLANAICSFINTAFRQQADNGMKAKEFSIVLLFIRSHKMHQTPQSRLTLKQSRTIHKIPTYITDVLFSISLLLAESSSILFHSCFSSLELFPVCFKSHFQLDWTFLI
jgi:hypothetical protein